MKSVLHILVLAATLFPGALKAQSPSQQPVKISGKFISDTDKTPLPGVIVTLYTPDSTKQFTTGTDNNGNFVFENITPSRYRLKASLLGFQDFNIRLALSLKDVNMCSLRMKWSTTNIKGVTINGIVPVQQKEDTTEYNADAFKTQPDATAEDLVNKMPGISSQNNAVTVNGEQVTQVLIDGTPYFGDDPMVALKNLPAEVIDKIQVFDKLSDQAQFTGFDDGNTQKTINIVTKRNRRNGNFGRVYGGYGTDQRYLAGGNMNFFNGPSRFSIIGLANNINQQNFATEDILGALGGSGNGGGGQGRGGSGGGPRSGGGGGYGGGGNNSSSSGSGLSRGSGNYLVGNQGGITTTNSLGLNFSDAWDKNRVKLTTSYFFNNAVNANSTASVTAYTGGAENSNTYFQNATSGSTNYNNRINGRLEWNLDTSNAIYLTFKGSLQQTKTGSDAMQYDKVNSILSDIEQSFSQTNSSSSSRGYDYSGNILFMHKFRKRGRTISWNIGSDVNNKNTPGDLFSLDNYFLNDTTTNTTLLNQQFSQVTQGYTFSTSLSYTQPIDSNSLLQFNYSPSVNINNTNKRTFNYDSTGETYIIPDTALSSQYENTYITQALGISYRLNHGKKYYFMLSVNPQYSTLTAQEQYPVSNLPAVQRNYISVLPRMIFNYKFSQSKNLRIMYRSNVTPPTISQLQNVVNNSNPLLLNTGNPQLKEDFEQSLIARYGATNSKAATTFLVYMYASYIQNYIGNASFIPLRDSSLSNGTILYTGSQLSQPVNLQGYWNAKAFVTYGWLIHPLRVNLNLNSGVVYTHTPALINDVANYSSNYTYSEGVVLSSNISENVDYKLSYTGNYSTVKNTLQNQEDDNYFTGIATGKINLIFFKGLIVNTSLSQTSYTGLAQTYNQAIYLWNASVGYKFLKNKALQVSISGTDLLNQNTSITRTVTDTYIQDSQTVVLRRYFMLNLQLNIRKYKTVAPAADDKAAGGKG